MENKQTEFLKNFFHFIAMIAGMVAIYTLLWTWYDHNTKECPIKNLNDSSNAPNLEKIDSENMIGIIKALEHEETGDNLYCSNYFSLFKNRGTLEKVEDSYLEAKEIYAGLQNKNTSLGEKVKELQIRLNDQQEKLISELMGAISSGQVGMGAYYRENKDISDQYQAELDSLYDIYEYRFLFYSRSIAELDTKIEMTKK